MFSVNGHQILESETTVLERFREYCAIRGIDIFRVIRPSGTNNLMTICPFHSDGQERRPSFGISTTDGTCHCFTCGWVGSLEELLGEILGGSEPKRSGAEWLSKNFVVVTSGLRQKLDLPQARRRVNKDSRVVGFTPQELESYRWIHPYMYERGLTDDLIEMFDIGYDADFRLKQSLPKTPCLTFPVYDAYNYPVFVARRAVRGKLFHYPSDTEKPVYAANMIMAGHFTEVIITESILNALTCWKFGRPAIALLGLGTNQQMKVLKSLPVRKYILGLDPDKAGREASEKLRNALKSSRVVTTFEYTDGRDLNDLDEEILSLKEFF